MQRHLTSFAIVLHKNDSVWASQSERQCQTYNCQVSPVKQIGETFGSVALDDALAPVQASKIEHVLRQLIDGVVQRDEAPVDDVNTVAHRVGDVITHEAAETFENISSNN